LTQSHDLTPVRLVVHYNFFYDHRSCSSGEQERCNECKRKNLCSPSKHLEASLRWTHNVCAFQNLCSQMTTPDEGDLFRDARPREKFSALTLLGSGPIKFGDSVSA